MSGTWILLLLTFCYSDKDIISCYQCFIKIILRKSTDNTCAWEQRKLGDFTGKVTEKNTGMSVTETFTNSAEFGVISQLDFFDHAVSKDESISGYTIVCPEDFVYNPRISVTAPVGPINRNRLNRAGVMSPLYTVFRTDGSIDRVYLEHFFKTSGWHSYMQLNGNSGARSDRFSIGDDTFFAMPIPAPSLEEQRQLAGFLESLDTLITLHQCKPKSRKGGSHVLYSYQV